MDSRFSRKQRLVTKSDYTLDKPHKISQKHWLILFKSNKSPQARLGLIVGKRIANLAVDRNRIKRVIRESFRARQEKLKGLDIIVIARHQSDELSKTELRKGIDKLWEKLIAQQPDVLSS